MSTPVPTGIDVRTPVAMDPQSQLLDLAAAGVASWSLRSPTAKDLTMSNTTEYGVVFEDATGDDLVGPTYPSLEEATGAAITGKSLGRPSALVFREDGGDWLTIYSRLSPQAWIDSRQVQG